MTLILAFILVLLSVGTAGADDGNLKVVTTIGCISGPEECEKALDRQIRINRDCLAKMEAAMREMDRFTGGMGGQDRANQLSGHGNGIGYPSIGAYREHYDSTYKLWESTKRDCWSEP